MHRPRAEEFGGSQHSARSQRGPLENGSGLMSARSNTFGGSTRLALFSLLAPLCVVAGCSSLSSSHRLPWPGEAVADDVPAAVAAPVRSDTSDEPVSTGANTPISSAANPHPF